MEKQLQSTFSIFIDTDCFYSSLKSIKEYVFSDFFFSSDRDDKYRQGKEFSASSPPMFGVKQEEKGRNGWLQSLGIVTADKCPDPDR